MRATGSIGLVLFGVALGCGDDEELPAGAGAAGGAVGSGGNGTLGTAGVGAGGKATGGSAGTGAGACTGQWGAPQEILRAEVGGEMGSPTLTADELELLYVYRVQPNGWQYRRSRRNAKSAGFPIGDVVPELDAACRPADFRFIDLSPDGLRAYVACCPDISSSCSEELRIARRSAIGAPFTLDPQAYGMVASSLAVSPNELTLYSSSEDRVGSFLPRQYTRTAVSAPFSAGTAVPGLENAPLASPDPSPDGLALYGIVDVAIGVATRERLDGPFGAPTIVLDVDPATQMLNLGSPEVSRDCRALYYIQVDVPVDPLTYTLRVVRR